MRSLVESMAAEVGTRHNKHPTISFTLPISCQVCLGKVKSPVICPNSHVFCAVCMDVWLQKNKHCPACRVTMSTPKKIVGGVNSQENGSETLTNPEFRKARFDILYKEYENEFERMQSEIQLLQTENKILKQQVKRDPSADSRSGGGESSQSSANQNLLLLTKKLQDATKLYEKVKGELNRLKQENSNLKDEGVSLNRENQHLRQELAGRSPHRYGRTTVSTLETKLTSAEKDVTRLTKALERSDKYIEELESEIDLLKGKSSSKVYNSALSSDKGSRYQNNDDIVSRKSTDSKSVPSVDYAASGEDTYKRQLFREDKGGKSGSGERSKYYYDNKGDGRSSNLRNDDDLEYDDKSQSGRGLNGSKKRVTFDLEKNTNATTSFDLEMPSPLKTSGNKSQLTNGRASPVKGVLKKANDNSGASEKSVNGYSMDLSKTLEDSLSSSYDRRLSDKYAKDDDYLYSRSRPTDRNRDDDLYSKSKKYSADDSVLDEPSDLVTRSKRKDDFDLDPLRLSSRDRVGGELDRHDLEDTQYIESELDELNISLTPEFTDCMKLLNRAEKKVQNRDPADPVMESGASRYKASSAGDSDVDAAFRASTGSMDYKRGGLDDLRSSYKTDTSKFTSSLDTYSRGKHVRSGSLDNLYMASRTSGNQIGEYKPGSALTSTSNTYTSSGANRYSGGGLTTGRMSKLTRTPSFDNLFTKPSGGYQSTFVTNDDPLAFKSRLPLAGSHRPYLGESEGKASVDGSSGTASGGTQPVTANYEPYHSSHGAGGSSSGARDSDSQVTFDAVLQARARTLADLGPSSAPGVVGSAGVDRARSIPGSGRSTPTLPITTSTGTGVDSNYTSGPIQPSIPTHSEYMASYAKTSSDKYSSLGSGGSGRLTPTLTSSSSTNYNPNHDYRPSGSSSYPTDLTMKPPSGSRVTDPGSKFADPGSRFNDPAGGRPSSMPGSNPSLYANTAPYPSTDPTRYSSSSAFTVSSSGYTNTSYSSSGEGPFSMPVYTSTGGGGSSISATAGGGGGSGFEYGGRASVPSANSVTDPLYSGLNSKDLNHDFGASSRPNVYVSDGSRYSASSSNVPTYNDHNYRDGTDFSNFSTKVAPSSNLPLPVSSISSSNISSASFTGSSSLGPGPSSYTGSSYMAATSMAPSSSYTTAHSIPITYTTSSYTQPSNTYASKPLDPISENNHFSYVSNVSADYSSKNDTFALPEPKKRLFENSDDLDLSVSPIKSNRRF